MDTPVSNKRKRQSPAPSTPKRRYTSSPGQLADSSHSQTPKLIDQLYKTWKNANLYTSPSVLSQQEYKLRASQNSISNQSKMKLKQKSLHLHFSELYKKIREFMKAKAVKEGKEIFCVKALEEAGHDLIAIYDCIKYMREKESSFDKQWSDASEIRTVIIQKQREKSEKLAVSTEEDDLEIEINNEKHELEYLEKECLDNKYDDIEKLDAEQEYFFNGVEQKLQSIKGLIKIETEKQISFENVQTEKTNQELEDNKEYLQIQQELETKSSKLKSEIKELGDVDEMEKTTNIKLRELISRKLNPESSIEHDFSNEIQQMKTKVTELELILNLTELLMEPTNHLAILESKLIEVNNGIAVLLTQNSGKENIEKSLIEMNKELELLQSEKTSEEIEFRKRDLEALIHQKQQTDKINAELLHELDTNICEKSAKFIQDLELHLAQKEKILNDEMEKYKTIKQENKDYFEKNPHSMETKSLDDFTALKNKLEIILTSCEKRETHLENKYLAKIKDLENISKKKLIAIKEVDQEYKSTKNNSKDNQFENVEKLIKEAEENLETKKKAQLQKEVSSVIINSEPVENVCDLQTLESINSLSKKLSQIPPASQLLQVPHIPQPSFPLFSDDESLDGNARFSRLQETYKTEPMTNTKTSVNKNFQSLEKNRNHNSLRSQSVRKSSAQKVITKEDKPHLKKDDYSLPFSKEKKLTLSQKNVIPEVETDKDDFSFPLSQGKVLKSLSEEQEIYKEDFLFPLSQGKGLKSFSEEQQVEKKDYSSPLSPGKNLNYLPKKQTQQDEKNTLSFPPEKPSQEKLLPQTLFDELLKENYDLRRNDAHFISSPHQTKVESSTLSTARVEKGVNREREKSAERRFFKMHSQPVSKSSKRSRSAPARK